MSITLSKNIIYPKSATIFLALCSKGKGFSFWVDGGGVVPALAKNLLVPLTRKKSAPSGLPPPHFYSMLPKADSSVNDNFHVITP